jgi:hypothetical protein
MNPGFGEGDRNGSANAAACPGHDGKAFRQGRFCGHADRQPTITSLRSSKEYSVTLAAT